MFQSSRVARKTKSTPINKSRARRLRMESLEERRLLAVLLTDSFEQSEWNGNWVEDGQNDWARRTQRAADGSYSAEVDGSATNATLTVANPLDLTSYGSAELTFSWYIESGFDSGEYIALDLFDGSSWTEVDSLQGNVDQENVWHNETITIDGNYLVSDFQARFRAKVSSSKEDGFVDNVKIEGTLANADPVGLISHWTAENTAIDVEGSNDGTPVSGAGYSSGQIGQGFLFDGVNDRVLIADSPSLRLTESMTIEGWVRVDSFTSGDGIILFRGDDRGGLDPFQLRTRFDGTIQFQIQDASNNGASVSAPMPQSEFVHVAATLDDATGEMSLYLNGVRMAQKVTTVRPFGSLDPNSNPGVGIGNHGGYPTTPHNFPFHGVIDELKIHDVPLSGAEILGNFNAGKGSLQPSISINDVSVVEGDSGFAFTGAFVTAGDGGLQSPRGIAFGPDGNLYVTSTDTDSVLRYDGATGAFIDEFVATGSGGLDLPKDINFHDGYLFVSSVLTDSVLRFNGATGAFVDEFITTGSGGLDHPRGLLFGTNNDLYVASAGEKDAVLRYNATTGVFIDEFIASGNNGMDNPTDIEFGPSGNVFVSSTASTSDVVLRYDLNGNFIDTFVSQGSGGLSGPADLHFRSGLLYVSGSRSDSILTYDEITGDFVGAAVFNGSGGVDHPSRMVFDNDGQLYVTSRVTNEVLRYGAASVSVSTVKLSSPSPDVVTVNFGTANGSALAGSDYESTTGTVTFTPGVTSQTILIPILEDANIETDETFDVILSNAINASIDDFHGEVTIVERRFSVDDVTVTEGDTTPHYRGAFAEGQPGAHFNPLTFGPDGFVYTAVGTGPGYNTIQKFDGTTGEFVETFMSNDDPDHKINGVRDIVFHPTDGRVYVASAYTNEVLRYDAATGDFVDVFVTSASGGIEHPDGMMFGPDTNNDGLPELYVTGWLSHNVVKYDGATGASLGGYVGSGSGGLSFPFSLAMRNNELFVISAGSNQILRYALDTGAYLGVAASAGLDYPRGITFGPDDLLYVTSGNNGRILRFTPQGAYVDDYVPAGTAGMDDPRTPRFGPEGDLYVTVTGKNEIMRFGSESEAVVTVTLSHQNNTTVTVDFTTNDGAATAGGDYTAISGTLLFEPGVTTRTILVPTIDDAVEEPTESFFVNLSGSTGAGIQDGQGIVTIVDNELPNVLPTANAGADQTVSDGDNSGDQVVTLNGSGSDSDGSIVSYAWTEGATILGNTASISPTLLVGTHTLTLTVTDNDGATANDTVVITVNPNQGPTANAGSDQNVFDADNSGSEVVTVVGSGNDSDGTIAAYQWSEGATTLGNTATISPNLTIGTHTLTLTVTDNGGATDSDTVVVTVMEAPSDAVLFEDSFEVGSNNNDWNGKWVEDSQNDFFRSTQRSTAGVRSAEVDGRATNATLTTSAPIDTSGYASAELTFDWLIEKGFDSGEYLSLDVSTNGGASWTQNIRQLRGNVDAENTWHNETVDLSAYASSNLLIRFRSYVSSSREDANIDNVKIVGSNSAASSASVPMMVMTSPQSEAERLIRVPVAASTQPVIMQAQSASHSTAVDSVFTELSWPKLRAPNPIDSADTLDSSLEFDATLDLLAGDRLGI